MFTAAAATSYQRNLSVEDDWVAVKESPFVDHDTFSLPAIAVDWNSSRATFNVTLLSINDEKSEERLWSDSFSISKIRRRHIELCLVHPDLKKHLPALPQESQGIWGYFQWIRVSPKLCKKLEEYIKEAFNICGWRVFSSVFFGEPSFLEADYTLSGLELKRNEYAKDVKQMLQNFELHVEERSLEGCTADDHLFKWYDKVDDLLVKVNEAERKLLEFDCEPYEELRDIAQKERSECATMLNQQSMTTSTFQDSAQNFSQWEEQYVESVEKINTFRMMYFKTTLSRSQNILKMLKEDFSKFPESSDKKESVVVRREQIEIEILKIEIKVLNCRNQKNILIRDKLRRDTVTLDEDLGMEEALNDKEIQFYQKQCEILGIENELLGKNESIVRLEMKRPKQSKEDEEKLRKTLSAFLRKKAALRNKRNACEAEVKKLTTKELQKQEKHIAHHAVQMKIEQRREDEEQKRETRVEERQKTLLRLKDYKKKYTKPSPVKPPRYQPPSTRKKSTSNKTTSPSSASTSCPPKKNVVPKSQAATSNTQLLPRKPEATPRDSPKDPSPEERSPEEGTNVAPSTVSPGSTFSPPVPHAPLPPGPPPPPPPSPPPGPPPPPPPPIALPLLSSGVLNGGTSLAQDVQEKKERLNHANASSSLSQPSSLSEETVNLEALLLARNRLKKQSNSAAKTKGFPSGNDLTRAIQSVKLKKVANDKKPAELSPDGAEFLKKALERMNRFTTLSDSEEEENEDELEQEW